MKGGLLFNKVMKSESTKSYVILVKKGRMIKGIARGWRSGGIDLTIKPSKMKRFKSSDKAREFYDNYRYLDTNIELYDIRELETSYRVTEESLVDKSLEESLVFVPKEISSTYKEFIVDGVLIKHVDLLLPNDNHRKDLFFINNIKGEEPPSPGSMSYSRLPQSVARNFYQKFILVL